MKGKTSFKIRINPIKRNPNASYKTQKWRYYFEAFAKIEQRHNIKIGKSILHIQPSSDEKIKGYYEFSFRAKEFINRTKASEIAKKDLVYYNKVFMLKNLHFSLEWKRLVCINSEQFSKPRSIVRTVGITYTIVPPNFSNEIIDAFPSLLQKIERSEHREQIVKCLDWMNKETKSDIERFLFMWISFNILYSTKYPTSTDTEAIENFSQQGIEYSKIESLLESHENEIKKMTELKLLSRNKVNHSKELKKARTKKKKKDILRHSLMCTWIIRGDLFHKGKQYDIFLGNLAGYIQAVIELGILKIL